MRLDRNLEKDQKLQSEKRTHLEKNLKDIESKASGLEKDLTELKAKKEASDSGLNKIISDLKDQLNSALDANEELKESLKKSQIEAIIVGDEAFDRAKE